MSKNNKSNVLPVEEHIKLLLYGEAHQHPCDTCSIDEIHPHLPPWYDKEKYARGQKYVKKNSGGLSLATLCGVITAFSIPSICTVLMKTHRSSTVYSAYRRYLSTIKHFASWYMNDLVPGTDAWKSLNTVRTRHIKWSKVSLLKKDGHISQRDLVLTLTAFGGMALIRPHLLAMKHDNKEDLEAFVHFWRTIGYMLGIEDRFNSFRPSLDETLLVMEAMCAGVYRPLIKNPPENFYHMSSAYIQSIWYLDPSISEGAMHYFNYRLLGCEGFEYELKGLEAKQITERKMREKQLKKIDFKKGIGYSEYAGKNENILVDGKEFYKTLGLYNRFILFMMIFSFQRLYTNMFGKIISSMKGLLTLILVFVFPFLFMIKFGFKGAYVDKYEEDVKMEVRIKTNREMLAERRF